MDFAGTCENVRFFFIMGCHNGVIASQQFGYQVVRQPILNSSPLFCVAQGFTTASPPPRTPLLDPTVRGYLRLAPSPLNT